jgi:hypothetical protein
MEVAMITRTFWMALIPVFVFFGLIGFGLLLKRIFPDGMHLTRLQLFGLISAGFILAVLLTLLLIYLFLWPTW